MIRLRAVLPVLALVVLATCAHEPETPTPPPPSETAARELLDAGLELGFPGFALVIDRAGQVWSGAAGHADLIANRSLEIDDPFHLASVTKAITAVATLRLVDRGELALDDRVVDLVEPRVSDGLPSVDRITVRHLLEHSSGLYSFNNDRDYWVPLIGADAYSGREWTARELLDFARREPAAGEPGSGFHYADTNYVLLGEVLTAVTGRAFKEIVQSEVLEPLEMRSTYFYSDYRSGAIEPVRPPVEGYLVLSEVVESFGLHPDLPRVDDSMLQSTRAHERSDTAAGVVASALDCHRFARALFGGDFLSPNAHAFLREPMVKIRAASEPDAWAGAVLRAYAKPYGHVLVSEGDGPGGVHTMLAYHAESDTVVVALANLFGRFDESDWFLDELLARVLG